MWTEITRPKYERHGGRYASDLTDREWARVTQGFSHSDVNTVYFDRRHGLAALVGDLDRNADPSVYRGQAIGKDILDHRPADAGVPTDIGIERTDPAFAVIAPGILQNR